MRIEIFTEYCKLAARRRVRSFWERGAKRLRVGSGQVEQPRQPLPGYQLRRNFRWLDFVGVRLRRRRRRRRITSSLVFAAGLTLLFHCPTHRGLMIGSFWNLCRACPSMPIDKVSWKLSWNRGMKKKIK